jgi:uncharacterized membrane protein (TIGR02234 family)
MTNTRRERLVVLALGVIGAALALLTATRPWLDVTIKDPLTGSGRLHPEGRDVAALVPAAALVALAASVAAVTLRRVGRRVAGLLLVAAAGGIASATVRVLTDPRSAAEEALRVATGRTGDVAATASVGSIWPWLALLAAVPIVLGGAVTIVRGRAWSGLSRRYDAPAEPAAAAQVDVEVEDADEAWDALSRGEDPTG